MESIGKYLKRHTGLTPPQATIKRVCIEVIQSECGIALSEKEIKIHNSGIQLTCHPAIRSEVMINAPAILSVLCQKYNVRISHIR